MIKCRQSAWMVTGLICLAVGSFALLSPDSVTGFLARTPRELAVQLTFGADQNQRDAAAVALKELGGNSVPELVEMLQAETPAHQPWLVGLALLLPEKPQDNLFRSRWLVDAAGLRLSATRALSIIGRDAHAAVPGLAAVTHDPDARVSLAALRALGKIGGDAFPVLTNALTSTDPDVRRQAAYALRFMDKDAASAAPLLAARLKDSSDVVAMAASQTLRHLRAIGAAVPPPDPRVITARELAQEDFEQTRREILPALHDFAWQQRDPNVLPVLTATLGDPDAVLRQWAAHALGKMGACGVTAMSTLTTLLGDHEMPVRAAATNAINEIQRALQVGETPCAAASTASVAEPRA